jgi:hypothetical protein
MRARGGEGGVSEGGGVGGGEEVNSGSDSLRRDLRRWS